MNREDTENKMMNGNVVRDIFKESDGKRFKIYFDNKPKNATEMDKRICIALKSSGQIIRLDEVETFDLIADLTKALKWKYKRSHKF
jgi:hypothetical protein